MSAKSESPNSEQGSARALVDDNPIVVAGNFVTDCWAHCLARPKRRSLRLLF